MRIITSFIILTVSLACLRDTEQERIVGKWKVYAFKADAPSLSSSLLKDAEEEALSTTYEFKADSTFWMTSGYITDGEGGKWRIDAANQLIMVYDPGSKQEVETYRLDRLEANEMEWLQDLKSLGSLTLGLKRQAE